MDKRSEIVFRDGPAGRRPGLADGADVWEVVSVHRSFGDVTKTAAWLDQPVSAIEASLRHYDGHRDEIDAWIRANEEAAEQARRDWRSTSRSASHRVPFDTSLDVEHPDSGC